MGKYKTTSTYLQTNRILPYRCRIRLAHKINKCRADPHATQYEESAVETAADDETDGPSFETSSKLGDMNSTPPDWDASSISDFEESVHLSPNSSSDTSFLESSGNGFEHNEEFSHKMYPDCAVTTEESLKIVSAFTCRHSVTKKATVDLLRLIKLHLPAYLHYPATSHIFQKSLGVECDWSTKIYYCKFCQLQLHGNMFCFTCNIQFQERQLSTDGYFYLSFNLRKQFELLLSDTTISSSIFKAKNLDLTLQSGGVVNGQLYLRLDKSTADLTCTFNSDGVPVFCSSKYSIWPVLFSVNELPYFLRKRNVLLGGLWFGLEKPIMQLFLKPIIAEMNRLSEEPIKWNLYGVVMKTRIYFPICSVDSVARCMMQGHKQFNGAYGCNWCTQEGKVIKKGNGHCRVYPFESDLPSLRKDNTYRNNCRTLNFINGQKISSPLLELKYFDLVDGFAVDYMHCVLLGVVRALTTKWLNNVGEPYYIGNKISLIDSTLLVTKVPNEIVRTFRSILRRKHWKVSEWRSWLFTVPVVLMGILDSKYLRHFNYLSKSIYLYTRPVQTDIDMDEAESNLQKFISKGRTLYGEDFFSFNVHQLNHISTCVKNWGPLWATSAFQFESFNKTLLTFIKSSNGVPNQIVSHYVDSFLLKRNLITVGNESEAQAYISSILLPKQNKDKILSSYKIVHDLDINTKEILLRVPSALTILSSKNGVIQGSIFRSKSTHKRDNSIIKISNNKLGRIQMFYKVICQCRNACYCEKGFVAVKLFSVKHIKSIPHIYYCKETHTCALKIVPQSTLTNEKFFVIHSNFKRRIYYVSVPNLFELD